MHMNSFHAGIALAVFATVSQAQVQTIVSPAQATSTEGSANNVFPFSNATIRHYQQIHSDIGGSPKVITKFSFRPNATTTTYTGTATVDTEINMCSSVDWDKASYIYANNYIGTPVNVVARKVLTWGPITTASPGPAPFLNMDIPLDAPYVYSGATSLLWEANHYAYATVGTFSGTMDADSSSLTSGGSTITGTGCVATGRTTAMTHTFTLQDFGGTSQAFFTVTNGPSSSPTVAYFGTTNPNLSLAGLCSNIYTDLLLDWPLGSTDAAGLINGEQCPWLVIPSLSGGTLTTQVHSLDLGRIPTDLPVANSNGRSTNVPVVNTTKILKITRLWNNTGGVTATRALATTSTFGYGLVTQFSY